MTESKSQKRPVGYARVSTYGQTLDIQLEQLRAAGCSSQNIYREKVTGARADRRELLNMLKALAPGERLAARVHHRLQHALRPRPGECQEPASTTGASR